jgi:hypothetical protein
MRVKVSTVIGDRTELPFGEVWFDNGDLQSDQEELLILIKSLPNLELEKGTDTLKQIVRRLNNGYFVARLSD